MLATGSGQAGDSIIHGQDIARGEMVLTRGSVLGAAEIGLLENIGQVRVAVPRPLVAVLANGHESKRARCAGHAGGIREANR